jgi:DNA-directed RNA polymerase subunit RPC12/RpoP
MVMRGDKPPKGDAWRAATLGNQVRIDHDLHLWCQSCGHRRDVPPSFFITYFSISQHTPLYILAQRLKCGKCNSRRVGLMLASHDAKKRSDMKPSESGEC